VPNYAQKEDILPVQLVYFNFQIISNGVLLRWGTATEVNNFGFEVQRADTLRLFQTLGFVPGHGNSNSPKHYMYVDSTIPNFGRYYYRLKQIDTDGTIHYSDTLTVLYLPSSVIEKNFNEYNKTFITNNPELRQITINFAERIDDEISIVIFSVLGEKVEEIFFSNFSNPIVIHHKDLPSGLYVINLISKSKLIHSQKVLILK
jgi:hypothetical protein